MDVTRAAQFYDDQGSIVLPQNGDSIAFTPLAVSSRLLAADQQEWPMGDVQPKLTKVVVKE